MLILILAYFGGILTIASPCILPVLPFVFARSDQSFLKSGLPLLAGMALTFTLVATLAAVGGGWVVQANQYGRWVALVLMAFFGVTLLFPHIGDRVMRPLVSAGNKVSEAATSSKKSPTRTSFLLGIATGLLWAPCAGPILGLVLTGAALQGANVGSSLLLLAYAAGAVTSLMLALLIGGKVFTAMKRSLGAGEWIRRGIGAAMLIGVVAIALGLDTGLLTRLSNETTSGLEQKLVDKFGLSRTNNQSPSAADENGAPVLSDLGPMPSLDGAVQWLNSPPLTPQALKGKVVLIDFWTYSCINCLRALPYVKAWADKYRSEGLVVIGVHAPEFAFERNVNNVIQESKKLGIDYPIAIDNNYSIWRAFNNQYWPAHYFIDAKGEIRYEHFGEGEYPQSERVIQQLLKEAGAKNVSTSISQVQAKGVEQAAGQDSDISPETYLGYMRSQHFASDNKVTDAPADFTISDRLDLNEWGLQGNWTVGDEKITLNKPNGRITYRFHARDLHLVLGPQEQGKQIRFKVTLDGKEPGEMHGSDISASGEGVVTDQRLYQLIRQPDAGSEHTFTIEFLDADVNAYAFTFG
ncbi:redoxin domain-containing protein [Rouxiella sp. S1S-2]|uniref:cytochrome c biogenesis protein DipZ n=1 Tax=Rouxiella sp. S1S-2 TaxID=2653856 RepID=UPI00126577B7|nr:cytochrome c biogenesis protein DipZ [Rouxiella sp. S1S-2]KAB7897168.1 redoxin domain-containing protein [Rouxiella sp. S1S-2]